MCCWVDLWFGFVGVGVAFRLGLGWVFFCMDLCVGCFFEFDVFVFMYVVVMVELYLCELVVVYGVCFIIVFEILMLVYFDWFGNWCCCFSFLLSAVQQFRVE